MQYTLRTMAAIASKVANVKSRLPILRGIAFDGKQAMVTDLETYITFPFITAFRGVLPISILKKALKGKPKAITLETDHLAIDGGKLHFEALPLDDFPLSPDAQSKRFKPIGIWDNFKQLAAMTAYVSKDELKPSLLGVYIHQAKGAIETAATDGHRLRVVKNVPADWRREFEGILPATTMRWLDKFGPAEVSLNDTYIRFAFADLTVTVRLIDERYPDYASVIPKDFTGSMEFDRVEMLAAVEKALAFADTTTKQGEINTGDMQITATDQKYGPHEYQWEATLPGTRQGEPILIGFNLAYLATVLKGMEAETVAWQYNSPISAGVFTDGPDSSTLLMPFRLND